MKFCGSCVNSKKGSDLASIFENKFLSVKTGTKDRKRKVNLFQETGLYLVVAPDILMLRETVAQYTCKLPDNNSFLNLSCRKYLENQ